MPAPGTVFSMDFRMNQVARLENVTKEYPSGNEVIHALRETTLDLNRNELVLIIGPSGSGKTTLLLILGGIVEPTSGEVTVEGNQIRGMGRNEKTSMRLQHIGFVFQRINLISPLNSIENVAFPARLRYGSRRRAREEARRAIQKVGLESKLHAFPDELSGGEQQRIAVARALVTDPSMMLCDEPTASLDRESMETVMRELKGLAGSGKSVVVVSHDKRLEEYSDRIIEVIDGKIKER